MKATYSKFLFFLFLLSYLTTVILSFGDAANRVNWVKILPGPFVGILASTRTLASAAKEFGKLVRIY